MTTIFRLIAVTAMVALTVLVPATAVADMTETAAGRAYIEPDVAAPSQFFLAMHSPDGRVQTATLTCSPVGGTHPNAITACDQLVEADGHLDRIPATPTLCPSIYAPVTVEATGHWHSRVRSFVGSFGNSCQAVAATGGVIFQY